MNAKRLALLAALATVSFMVAATLISKSNLGDALKITLLFIDFAIFGFLIVRLHREALRQMAPMKMGGHEKGDE